MRKQTYKFDQELIKRLVASHVDKEPSGRMSATRLTWPTQWQILWMLKVPTSPESWKSNANKVSTLHFRHFARGKQCEDWLQDIFPAKETQKECLYRGWVGFADRIDEGHYFGTTGDVPHEIKSVKADKWYKMFIEGNEGPQYDHVLQSNFYAMALDMKEHALTYLKSDTLETRSFLYSVEDYRKDVDSAIDAFFEAVNMKTVPVFKAKVDYQKNPKYNQYWEYMEMDEKKLQEVYDAYKHNLDTSQA